MHTIFAHSFRELRDSHDSGVVAFGRTTSGDDAAWRIVDIPKVLYVQINRKEEQDVEGFRAVLTARLSQLSNLKPDVVASQFRITGPEWRSIAPKVSSKRHQRVHNGFQEDDAVWEITRPFSTTVSLRVMRVAYPWGHRINWTKTAPTVELDQFARRIFTENLNLTQRVLLEKRIRGPTWLTATRAIPIACIAEQAGVSQQVRKLRQKRMTTCSHEMVVEFDQLVPSEVAQATEPLQQASLAAIPLRVTTMSLGVARSVTSSESERNNCLSTDASSSEAASLQSMTHIHSIAGLHQSIAFSEATAIQGASAFLFSCSTATPASSSSSPAPSSTLVATHVAREEELFDALVSQLRDTDIFVGYRLHEEILPLLYARMPRALFLKAFTRLDPIAAARTCPVYWSSWFDMEPHMGGRLFCNLSACVTDRACTSIESHYQQQREVSATPDRLFRGERVFGTLDTIDRTFASFPAVALQTVQDTIQLDYIAQQTSIVPILFQRAKLVGARLATVFNRSKIAVNDEHLMTAFFNDGLILRECCVAPSGRRTHTFDRSRMVGGGNRVVVTDTSETVPPTDNSGGTDAPKHGKFSGGRWIAAVRGLHEYAFELDAFAFYATIFQSLNTCLTNAEHAESVERQPAHLSLERLVDRSGATIDATKPLATTPKEIARLTEVRRLLNLALARCTDADERQMLLILIAATKISINSIYGCYGNENSRFYFPAISAAVAAYGRALHEEASELLIHQHAAQVRVVYGATDSLLLAATPELRKRIQSHPTIDLQYRAFREVAELCVVEVNQRRPAIRWVLEDLFSRVLLLESNRYVAFSMPRGSDLDHRVSFSKSFHFIGLDMHQGGMYRALIRLRRTVLTRMLLMLAPGDVAASEHSDADARYIPDSPLRRAVQHDLTEFVTRLKQQNCMVEELVITNQLKQRLDQYDAAATDPHVQVARLMVQFGINVAEKGSTIDYVMCKGDILRFRERETIGVPYQLVRDDNQQWFAIDVQWYLGFATREIKRLLRGFPLVTVREIEQSLSL